MKAPLHWILTNSVCRCCYALNPLRSQCKHHSFPWGWAEWMMDLQWPAQVPWHQGWADQSPLKSPNSKAQSSARGAKGFSAFQFPVAELIPNSCRVTVLFPLKRKQMDPLNSKYKILPSTLLLVLPSLTELFPSLLTVLKEGLRAWVCNTHCEEGVTQTPISYCST